MEDVYYNGNPWYLNTFAAAEQLYDAVYVWKETGSITITDVSLPFFKDLLPSVATGTYASDSATYKSIIEAVFAYADGFMDIAAKYTLPDGSLPEQYDRNTGKPLGAADLTWSYSAFLTAAARRAGVVPPGWSAENGIELPESCSRMQVAGRYALATKTSFPPGQTPNPGTGPGEAVPFPTGCSDPGEAYVTFAARVRTEFGQTVKVVGSAPELGGWDVAKAPALSASAYAADDPLWSITVPMRADGAAVEYKYVNVQADGSVRWEADPNRRFMVPGRGADGACVSARRDDYWR